MLTCAEIHQQWTEQFGYRPLLAESSTDPEAYAGTSYKATNSNTRYRTGPVLTLLAMALLAGRREIAEIARFAKTFNRSSPGGTLIQTKIDGPPRGFPTRSRPGALATSGAATGGKPVRQTGDRSAGGSRGRFPSG